MMAFWTWQDAFNFAAMSIRTKFWQRARIWKTGDLWIANSALYAIAPRPYEIEQRWYHERA